MILAGEKPSVFVPTTVIGVSRCRSNALGEVEHTGCGAVPRFYRDGLPHKGKYAVAAGGGNLGTEVVTDPVGTRLKAIAPEPTDESKVDNAS